MHVNVNVPFISPVLAVDYFFICSPDGDRQGRYQKVFQPTHKPAAFAAAMSAAIDLPW